MYRNKFRFILVLSLIVNLFFLSIGLVFIYKKGGSDYIIRNAKTVMGIAVNSNYESTPYYYDRKSIFENLDEKNKIVFLGDSLVDGNEWSESFNNNSIVNRGISGDTTKGVLDRLDNIIDSQPRKIFLLVGVNDLLVFNQDDAVIIDNYQAILDRIKKGTPSTDVFVIGLTPINSEIIRIQGTRAKNGNEYISELNRKLEKISKQMGFKYIDSFDGLIDSQNQLKKRYTHDGLHLNKDGYEVLESKIPTLVN